jgi:hypothetical protein
MKVEDLMIGDWVCLEDENLPLEERYFKIEYLAISAGVSWVNQGTNASIGLGDGESLIPVFRDEIYPIPLTPEILEKNGFEAIKEGRYPSLRNYYNDIIFQLEGIKEEGNCKILYIFKNIPILYVHQLQHALKLCGIDKEIVV